MEKARIYFVLIIGYENGALICHSVVRYIDCVCNCVKFASDAILDEHNIEIFTAVQDTEQVF